MRNFLIFTLFICFFYACTKDFIQDPVVNNTEEQYSFEQMVSIAANINTRDGVKPSLIYPKTLVKINVFDSTQTAFNQKLLTANTSFLRMGNEVINVGGSLWGNYIVTLHYLTHDTIIKSFAPLIYGSNYVVVPSIEFNQLDNSSLSEFVYLKQTPSNKPYYDFKCGKEKRKYQYVVKTNTFQGFEYINPNKCNTYGFGFTLII